MGQYAEDILNGFCDESGNYTYRYNVTKYKHQSESQAEKNIRRVRKELAILIKKLKSEGIIDPVNSARNYVNFKYGKGWRERGLVSNSNNQWKSFDEY